MSLTRTQRAELVQRTAEAMCLIWGSPQTYFLIWSPDGSRESNYATNLSNENVIALLRDAADRIEKGLQIEAKRAGN